MVNIKIEKFAKTYVERNNGEDLKQVTKSLKEALKRKNSGAKCSYCDEPIWAIGSAITGFDGYFSCITGEAYDSDDYEVY